MNKSERAGKPKSLEDQFQMLLLQIAELPSDQIESFIQQFQLAKECRLEVEIQEVELENQRLIELAEAKIDEGIKYIQSVYPDHINSQNYDVCPKSYPSRERMIVSLMGDVNELITSLDELKTRIPKNDVGSVEGTDTELDPKTNSKNSARYLRVKKIRAEIKLTLIDGLINERLPNLNIDILDPLISYNLTENFLYPPYLKLSSYYKEDKTKDEVIQEIIKYWPAIFQEHLRKMAESINNTFKSK